MATGFGRQIVRRSYESLSLRFYFGAFGNNYVDHGTIDRYRGVLQCFLGRGHRCNRREQLRQIARRIQSPADALPGVRDDVVRYVNWARLTLFSSGLLTNVTSTAGARLLCQCGNTIGFPHSIVHLFKRDTFRRLCRRSRS